MELDKINCNFARIRIDSYNFFTHTKNIDFSFVTLLIKSVVSKNKFKYYYNIF